MRHPSLSAGRRAVVTGARQGIGFAIAQRFREFGMEVILVDLPGEKLEAAGAQLDARVEPADVADWQAMSALAKRTGPIDVLINNAATRIGRGLEASLDDWQAAFQVNFWGAVHGVRAFLPGMQQAGAGLIVNVGSKQGITNPPGHPVYNATKAALKSYTESLQNELRKEHDRISAHLLIPGWTLEDGPDRKPGAWTPDQVASFMIEALGKGDFYILCPDNDVTTEMDHKRIRWGAEDIIENRPALTRWHPEWANRAAKACS
ncbi:MAG: SDR family NAD(P)-dependent oxidoreductase [Pseudomonadota bacterium]